MRLALTIIIVVVLLAILASIVHIIKKISNHRDGLKKVACPQCGAGFALPAPNDDPTVSQRAITCTYCGTKFER